MVLLLPYVLLLATKWSSSWSYNLLGSDVKEPFNIKSSFHHCSPIVGGKLKIIITVLTKVYFYSKSKCFYVTFLGVEVWGILVCLNYSMLLLNQCIMVIKKIYILRKLDSQKDPEKCWSKYFWLLFVIDAWKPYLILTYTPIRSLPGHYAQSKSLGMPPHCTAPDFHWDLTNRCRWRHQ